MHIKNMGFCLVCARVIVFCMLRACACCDCVCMCDRAYTRMCVQPVVACACVRMCVRARARMYVYM